MMQFDLKVRQLVERLISSQQTSGNKKRGGLTISYFLLMAPAVGFEPTPAPLDDATLVLKTSVLPLHYADIFKTNAHIVCV